MKKTIFSLLAAATMSVTAFAASIQVKEVDGWFESGYVTWSAYSGASDYNVYVKASSASSWTKLDKELVRQYNGYYRADALGLKAGSYQFKVEPVTGSGAVSADATVTTAFTVAAHDRSGFAHVGMNEGIGAYKNDGTLKDNAQIIYVYANNAKTVTHDVITSSKGGKTTGVGLQDIITYYQKGYDTTPLAIRIIGTIKAADMDRFDSSAEGLQVKGNDKYSDMPITIEGVGCDAAIHGFGILARNCHGTEFRNFAIMLCMDDCLSLDSYNSNVWVHNMDFFYGSTGGDADQAKGDGTVDIKGLSKNCTVSYNHFYDSGKCSLGGMKSETTDCWMTYHHNWFDHSDSRHPRIRTAFYHVYNNYYDGNSKYGVGVTYGGSAFVENNYFRNCKYPMLISLQGTDAEGDGTFSGESGGVIKAYNNITINPRKLQYNTGTMTNGKWDAVLVTSRDATVSATAFSGGTEYNAEADAAARSAVAASKVEDPSTVVSTIKSKLGAGRMQHGDFTWTFSNASQDENYGVIKALKDEMTTYTSTLKGFANGVTISNGGASQTVNAGDGKGISQAANDAHVPSWGNGTIMTDGEVTSGGNSGGQGSTPIPGMGEAVLGGDDYFWFNESNKDKVNGYIADGTITGGTFAPSQVIKSSGGDIYSDYTGSIRLEQNASLDFYLAEGISKIDLYVSGNGSMTWQIATSDDGVNFTDLGSSITGNKGSHPAVIAQPEPVVKYIRIINKASGNRDVQGVKLYKAESADGGNDDGGSDDGEEDETPGKTVSNLDPVVESLSLEAESTLQLAKGTHFTTSSTGAITYRSSNQSVATISASGLITALTAGSTTITIAQAEDEEYEAGTVNVTLIVTEKPNTEDPDDSGEDDPKPEAPATVKPTICSFTGSKPSSDMVSVNGSYSTKYGPVTYDGVKYGTCVKMESSTSITLTPDITGTITLVFNSNDSGKKLKIDGNIYNTDSEGKYTFDVTSGTTYTLTKGDVMYLFLVIFTPSPSDTNLDGKINVADVITLVNQEKATEAKALAKKIIEAK